MWNSGQAHNPMIRPSDWISNYDITKIFIRGFIDQKIGTDLSSVPMIENVMKIYFKVPFFLRILLTDFSLPKPYSSGVI